MLSSGLAHVFWCSEPLLFSHLVKQGAVVPWDGLRGRHAQASGFYLRRPGGHCHQPSANNHPSTPSALCDWNMAVQPPGRDPATVTLLPAPHKRATRVSLHTQATPPHRTERLLTARGATLQPNDTLLAGQLAGPQVAPGAGCPGKRLAPEPEAAEHISSGPSKPRASAPSHHCSHWPCLPAQHISI